MRGCHRIFSATQQQVCLPDENIKITTFRLEPDLKKFCEDHAKKLGVSMQTFIAMVLKAVMLQNKK